MSAGVLLIKSTAQASGSSHDVGVIRGGSMVAAVTAGSGARTATVHLDVSNDGVNWVSAGNVAITEAAAGLVQLAVPVGFVRARVAAIGGTGCEASAHFVGL